LKPEVHKQHKSLENQKHCNGKNQNNTLHKKAATTKTPAE